MLVSLYQKIGVTSPASIIIALAIMMFSGFLMTRITKLLKLPNVTAYIITGILIGPYVLNLIPQEIIAGTDFVSDIALAFIAFSVGEFFKLSVLRKSGFKVIIITIMESLVASLAIFILTYFCLHLSLAFSALLSALAAATAPASSIMTIRQTKAKGDLVNTLLQVVALDDVVGLIAFSVAMSIALSSISGSSTNIMQSVISPILTNLGVLILGCSFGFVLKLAMTSKRTDDNRLIIAISILLLFCGICSILSVSPLLGCMSMGMVYINLTNDDKLFMQIDYFDPPILLLFFVRSGLSFNLNSLFANTNTIGSVSLVVIGIWYFFIRIIGKYVGAYLGCLVTGKDKKVRNYLGLALIPQAGVAIGLAAMAARVLGPQIGGDIQTIILASSVLYEMIGPGCAKLALYLSGSYSNKIENLTIVPEQDDTGQARPAVDILIDRIQEIQKEIPDHKTIPEDEQAFMQAIEEQYAAQAQPTHYFKRRI